MHLEGYIYSQETCNHTGEQEHHSNGTRYGVKVAKDFTQKEGYRLPLPYDTVICLNCGMPRQLLWVDKPTTEEGK